MQVRVLGPLQVALDGRVWSPAGPKERRLLAVLVLHLGETVSLDTLVEALWDGDPPRSAVKSAQVHVTRLRAALGSGEPGGGTVRTVGRGYRLEVNRGSVDAYAFIVLVDLARRSLDAGLPEDADRYLDDAFALWRGEPYGEFADSGVFAAGVRRLAETRLTGMEARLAAGLALGRNAEVVAEAQALCAGHPLHEQLWAHLATALYRCDRQADALAALRQLRALLIEEIGADPGAEIDALEQRLLRHDPALTIPSRAPATSLSFPPELDPAGLPFYGRADDLEWLYEAWSEVSGSGRSRLLAVVGPVGSGRTRLIAQFAAGLHASGVAVHHERLRPGLAVFDNVHDRDGVAPWQFAEGLPERLLCLVSYDPATATPALRQTVLAAASGERALLPLGREDIAQIIGHVAGPLTSADWAAPLTSADVDTLTDAAHGLPGLAEQLAEQLIEERSELRVVAAVNQANPASRTLAAARDEVASGVRDLTRVRAARRNAGADRIACPYKGLARYEQGDAALFHGREDLVGLLCARLVDTAFVAVVGPSGAGKSSLVRAGLLPALAAGVLPGLVDAEQHILAPGVALPALDTPALVVVDQFEEVFAAIPDDDTRDRYLDELTALADRPATRIVVVLRSDFVGACAAHHRLAKLLGDGTVLIGSMRPEEIQRAVELPARHVGLRPEPGLVDAIVSDMRAAPGALPLMSTALVAVWQHRAGNTMTTAAYHRAGGVSGALTRYAEAAFGRLDKPAQEAARRILLRLADTGEGGELVRRRVARRQLGDDPPTEQALSELVNRRLLTVGESGVEVTHEALLTHWPRLAGWLAEDEHGRELRHHLAPAAAEWDDSGRPDSELYRGARLASALDWAGDSLVDLTDTERRFLTAGRDYADRELAEETARADRQTRARRRLVAALAAAVGLLLVASGATWVAVNRQQAASAAGRRAQAHRLGALALVTPDLDRSLLLAVQAVRTIDDWETRGDLLAVLSRSPQALRQIRDESDTQTMIEHVALTPDGTTLVGTQGIGGGQVFTWNAETLIQTSDDSMPPPGPRQRTEAMTPGADPSAVYIPFAIDWVTREQEIVYWDARTRQQLKRYRLPDGVKGSSFRVAESVDRSVLAVPTQRSVLLFDRVTGALRAELAMSGSPGDLWPIGPLLMTANAGSSTVQFIDPVAGTIAGTLELPFVGKVIAHPAGDALLVYSAARAALIGIPDGRVIREFAGASRAGFAAAFSRDGTRLAVGGDDQLIGVWDVHTGDLRDTMRGHAAAVHGLVFSADGRRLFSASQDKSVIVWDVDGSKSFASRTTRVPVLPRPAITDPSLTDITAPSVMWTADRRRFFILAGDDTGTAALVDVASGRPVASRPFLDAKALWTSISAVDPDRPAMFGATAQGSVFRFDLRTGATVTGPSIQPPLLYNMMAVSADGQVLTVETLRRGDKKQLYPHELTVLDAETLTIRQRLPTPDDWFWSTWLNGDGSLLLTTSDTDAFVDLWDTRTGNRRWRVDTGIRNGQAFALSPDGRTLAIGTLGGQVALLDYATGQVRAQHSLRLSTQITSVDFAPDGGLIALGGNDGQVHLLAADTLREVSQLPIGTGGTWTFVAHSADHSTLLAVDEQGNIVRWDARPQSWIRRACAVAARDLTVAEWATYLPGVPRQPTCTA